MLRVVYYTSGITGAGRIVIGIAIGNALKRRGIDFKFTILHSSKAGHLADDFSQERIPFEDESELSRDRCRKSYLYKKLKKLKPDILLINHTWFMVHNFIEELPCKKIYLSDCAYDSFFDQKILGDKMTFQPEHYDKVIAIEPFTSSIPMVKINPLIMRNKDEIFSRQEALDLLGLRGDKKVIYCPPGISDEAYEKLRTKYPILDDDGYENLYETMKYIDHFPKTDLYNAFDIVIGMGGYTLVWEAVYFGKKAYFMPERKRHSDQADRVDASWDFSFEENGADQLVEIMLGMTQK